MIRVGDTVECDVNGDWEEPEPGIVTDIGRQTVWVRHPDDVEQRSCRFWLEEVRHPVKS